MMGRLAIVAAFLLLIAAAASAANVDVDTLVETINGAGAAAATRSSTLTAIARAIPIPPADLRAEQAREALPLGDLFIAHRIASRGGHPIEKVFGARKTGASWKQISEDAKVDDALLAQDLLGAFPKLAPPPPRPVAGPAVKTPSSDDADAKRREEEGRDFMRGERRR